jgi:WD40 repeat protein/serine/threonine protein kinase
MSRKDDDLADVLAAYDDALWHDDAQPDILPSADGLADAGRVERLTSLMKRLQRVSQTVLDTPNSTVGDPSAMVLWDIAGAAKAPAPEELFSSLGRFEIVRQLGAGGGGVVLLARDPALDRFVALKVPRPKALFSSDLRARFVREARAAARLKHPNLVSVFEAGEIGTVCYIASTYCDGPDLAAWLKERSRPVSGFEAASIAAVLADAIDYAHGQGVLHRDLKPSNVLLEPSKAAIEDCLEPGLFPFTPKITDFGLAKLNGAVTETRSGAMLGTLAYMSPEQADSRRGACDPSTDVYGLGAILYELIAGVPPFQGQNDAETLQRVLNHDPVSPSRLRADISPDLEAICLKCLEKAPRRRYPAAAELAADLRRYLAGRPTHARPLNRLQRFSKWTRRQPALAALTAIACVASIAIAAMTSIYIVQLRKANSSAESSRAAAEISTAEAKHHLEMANQHLYASQMRLAYQWLVQGELQQADTLLKTYAPGTPRAQLRGFEWFHLQRQFHGERLTLEGHTGEVYAVTFTPDGRQVVSGGEDGTIRWWDATGGQAQQTVAAHRSCVNVLDHSPDGRLLASGSCDGTIKLWDATTHELIQMLDMAGVQIHAMAFSPSDSNCLAAAGERPPPGRPHPFVTIWSAREGEVVRSFDTDRDRTDSLAWNPSGTRLYVASGNILECDLDSGTVTTKDDAEAQSVVARADELYLGLGGPIHRTANASKPIVLRGHVGAVEALALSPRGDRLVSGGSDKTIRIWDTKSDACLQVMVGHSARVEAVAYSPRGATLASASFDGTVKLWNETPQSQHAISFECCPLLRNDPVCVALSADLRYLAAMTRYDELGIWCVSDASLVDSIPLVAPTAPITFLPNQHVLFGLRTTSPNQVTLWDVDARKSIEAYRVPADVGLVVHPYGDCLLMVRDTAVEIVERANGHVRWQVARPDLSQGRLVKVEPVFSPSGDSLAITVRGNEGSWMFEAANRFAPLQIDHAVRAISPSERFLAAGTHEREVVLVDRAQQRELAILPHDVSVGAVVFSPDDKTVVTACGDGSIRLWHVQTGQEITRFDGGGGLLVRFSADGQRLAAISMTDLRWEPQQQFRDGTKVEPLRATLHLTIWDGGESP